MTDKNFTHDNFIGVYHDVYPEGYCEHLIAEFNRMKNGGAGVNRIDSENALPHNKDDYHVGLNVKAHSAIPFEDNDIVDMFFSGLQGCFEEYIKKYSVLGKDKIIADSMKMQCTSPGGGYHIWHHEQGPERHAARVLVYSLYLNDVDSKDAGETEFLYQQIRVNPKKNKMVIWPAAFTHTHRGNTLFGEKDKYIVTGWFYYNDS
jgi:hypothetical protein